MAQTKAASPGQRSGASKKSQTRARGKPKPKARTSAKARKPAAAASKLEAVSGKPKAAGEAIEETAKDAGRAVGRAASKAKVPLMAGGAALAGAAGGIALGAHQARRKNGFGGVNSHDVAKAARKAGDFGAQVGEIALEVRRAREASNGKSHRSPIEVVLQGLTSRHPRD
jgi:hypothetical protein